ncbi:hypothetical protein HYH02_006463 [Chlamydomonas schloesseri]|uniref:Protein kinase domain-containing protein n=1 Tax=Chlamydomonas schloesseri TaxID=2026947 RepID=A0A835WJ77_9CHLO|nr:hypothetical protein HYH02_006463 [Chlamydomonas schloesseri]|eukprot:KAG2448572.1 hypothetical protein HYH02_006463 [Chlamydomonas schloesseri]
MTAAPKQPPPALPPLLAKCFGFFGLVDEQRAKTVPPPVKPPPPPPKRPDTEWRDIPLVQRYNLKRQLGKGGFSEVWLSEHKETGETVAIKVVQLAHADLEPEEIATLIAEAKFLRSLDCPYILKCYETTHTSDWLVLTLEYLTGGEVFEHIHKVKKYTEVEAAKLFAQVVSAISYLHNLNLMHRDIKPENVMFTQPVETFQAEGKPLRVKVIDFGMCAQYNADKPIMGCVGTPGFVPPEVWNDKPHSFAMDIYALGIALFIMLTGRKPFSGQDIRKMTYCNKPFAEAPGLQDERYLALSAEAKSLLLKMLADDPKARPTCLEVLKHPFMTADESNAAAHREMGDLVRNRMRDLAKIRRLHGLRYAMHAQRREGTSATDFLQELDRRRRMQLARERENANRAESADSPGPSPTDGNNTTAGGGGGGGGSVPPTLRRSSLWNSYGDDDTAASGGPYTRPSVDGAVGGSAANKKAAVADKLALMAALPDMQRATTMPARRFKQGPDGLSPVPSCDPSMYAAVEDAALPQGWSAYPIGYEALEHKEVLLEGLGPGTAAPAPFHVPVPALGTAGGAGAAAAGPGGRGSSGGIVGASPRGSGGGEAVQGGSPIGRRAPLLPPAVAEEEAADTVG